MCVYKETVENSPYSYRFLILTVLVHELGTEVGIGVGGSVGIPVIVHKSVIKKKGFRTVQ